MVALLSAGILRIVAAVVVVAEEWEFWEWWVASGEDEKPCIAEML